MNEPRFPPLPNEADGIYLPGLLWERAGRTDGRPWPRGCTHFSVNFQVHPLQTVQLREPEEPRESPTVPELPRFSPGDTLVKSGTHALTLTKQGTCAQTNKKRGVTALSVAFAQPPQPARDGAGLTPTPCHPAAGLGAQGHQPHDTGSEQLSDMAKEEAGSRQKPRAPALWGDASKPGRSHRTSVTH